MKTNLYQKLCRLREHARQTGVNTHDPKITIEKTEGGLVILRDSYGNLYQEIAECRAGGLGVCRAMENFPESFPKIRLSKIMHILRMAYKSEASVDIWKEAGKLKLQVGENYIFSIPLPSY